MHSQSRDNLRHEVFDAMGKYSETHSGGRVIENITQTRRLMYALNEFYESHYSETNLITKGHSALE